MKRHKYKNIASIDKVDAERIFASNNVENICDAMLSITFYENDWKWVQDKCLILFQNANPKISSLAATCLGHIARIHRKLEKEKVIKILRERLDDKEISGWIEDALDDIKMFIRE
jgi:hypothetical protein